MSGYSVRSLIRFRLSPFWAGAILLFLLARLAAAFDHALADQAVTEDTCRKDELEAAKKELHDKMLSEVKQYLASRETGRAPTTNCREIAQNPIRSNPCGIETRVTFRCTIGDAFVPWEREVKIDAQGSTDRNGTAFFTVVSYVSKLDETEPKLGKDGREHWRSQPLEAARERRGRLADCHADFALPSGWQIDVRESSQECRIRLRPGNWKEELRASEIDVPDFPLEVRLSRRSFLQAAEEAGFAWRQGRWIAYGRQGMETGAVEIRGDTWVGLQASPSVGEHYKRGGYAGLGDADRVLIQAKDGRIAFIDGSGAVHVSLVNIVETFRFIEESPKPK